MNNLTRHITKLLAPMRRRVALMVGRCVLLATDDAKPLQELQIRALADEQLGRVERLQEYGFTSHAHPNAEGVLVCVGGSRNHALVIAVEDKRYRLTGLKTGEVAIYDDLKQSIILKRKGIEITTTRPEGVKVTAPKVQIYTKETILESDTVTVKASTIAIDCPTVTLTGDLAISGKLSSAGATGLGGGSKKVARVGDSIRLTSGECAGAVGVITSGAPNVKA